jgi:NhaP-type Na+/H+ or K+/H+ antiporter
MMTNNISLVFVMTLERLIMEEALAKKSEFIENFMKVGLLSPIFGLSIGAIITLMMRKATWLASNAVYEVYFVITGAYAAYMLAHLGFFQLSGDVAIFCYGFVISHYNTFNMSLQAVKHAGVVLNVFFVACEAICFTYLALNFENAIDSKYYNVYIAIGIIFILIGTRLMCLMVIAFFHR